jgi:hypothetical protein
LALGFRPAASCLLLRASDRRRPMRRRHICCRPGAIWHRTPHTARHQKQETIHKTQDLTQSVRKTSGKVLFRIRVFFCFDQFLLGS